MSKSTPLIKNIQNNWTNEENNYKLEKHQFRASTGIFCSQRVFFSKLFEMPELQKLTPKIAVTFEPDLFLEGIFASGNAVHDFIEKVLAKINGCLIAKEMPISKEFKNIELLGHFDLLILEPDHGLKVVDIKSVNPKSFPYKINEPGIRNLEQANLYAYILNTSHFSILYVNRDNYSDMVEHERETNNDMAIKNLEKMNFIYSEVNKTVEFLKNGGTITGKEVQADREDWECRYCPCNDICKQ